MFRPFAPLALVALTFAGCDNMLVEPVTPAFTAAAHLAEIQVQNDTRETFTSVAVSGCEGGDTTRIDLGATPGGSLSRAAAMAPGCATIHIENPSTLAPWRTILTLQAGERRVVRYVSVGIGLRRPR